MLSITCLWREHQPYLVLPRWLLLRVPSWFCLTFSTSKCWHSWRWFPACTFSISPSLGSHCLNIARMWWITHLHTILDHIPVLRFRTMCLTSSFQPVMGHACKNGSMGLWKLSTTQWFWIPCFKSVVCVGSGTNRPSELLGTWMTAMQHVECTRLILIRQTNQLFIYPPQSLLGCFLLQKESKCKIASRKYFRKRPRREGHRAPRP